MIRNIGREANFNELMSERLEHWKSLMRSRGAGGCSTPSFKENAKCRQAEPLPSIVKSAFFLGWTNKMIFLPLLAGLGTCLRALAQSMEQERSCGQQWKVACLFPHMLICILP